MDMLSGRTLSTNLMAVGRPQCIDTSPSGEMTIQLNTHPISVPVGKSNRKHALQDSSTFNGISSVGKI